MGRVVHAEETQDYLNDPRDIATKQTETARLFQLAALLLQSQMQRFLPEIATFCQQLIRAHFLKFFEFYHLVRR